MTLEEVHPETLDYLRPLLRHTLDTGDTVQLPHTAWYLHAPPLTMQVERSNPPCCTVSITDNAGLDEFAADEAGELKRSIAWAWLIDGKGN